jgi:2-oxoglutarate ferredoxin oxidoreductase subunit alpha
MGNKNHLAAYFTRGTGHDEYAGYSEDAQIWEKSLERLKLKFETAKQFTPKPEIILNDASTGIISLGSAHFPVVEARDLLLNKGIKTDYLRLKSIPIHDEVKEFVKNHDRNYIVELNRDGQIHQILSLNIPEENRKLWKVSKIDGMPLTAKWIVNEILSMEEK